MHFTKIAPAKKLTTHLSGIAAALATATLLASATAQAQTSHPTRPAESFGQAGARPDNAPQRPAESYGQQRQQNGAQGGGRPSGSYGQGGGRPGAGGRPR